MNAIDLLIEYRRTRSEEAFAGLVRRYANLVYSAAKRRLSNASLAEEVAQTVFSRLAHAPPKLGVDAELAAWLHRTTVHVAIDVWRSETRRRNREQSAVMMQSASAEPDRLWDEVAPMLDEALDGLADADRQVLLFRFFDRKAMRDIGEAFGITEET
jgi:RNA polymerase sigma factor (sigma-70 family)